MIYVYAVTTSNVRSAPDVKGFEEAEVSLVRARGVAAVVSPIQSNPDLDEANVLRHEAVVEAAMALGPVLPVRFGTLLADEDAVREAIEIRRTELAAGLRRVKGRVELALRVLWSHDDGHASRPAVSAASGRDYLLTSLEQSRQVRCLRRRAEARARDIHRPLASLAADSTCHVLNTSRQLLLAAYLVDRRSVAAFRRELDQLTSANPDLRMFCTGPWPPFSFVGAGGGVAVATSAHE